jgi:hypothetical protein
MGPFGTLVIFNYSQDTTSPFTHTSRSESLSFRWQIAQVEHRSSSRLDARWLIRLSHCESAGEGG